MLSGDFSGYFVAGLKLQWNIGALYTRGLDKRRVNADAQKIDLTRKSFILNSSVEAEQKNNAILKARDVLEKDSEIIGFRQRIRASGASICPQASKSMSFRHPANITVAAANVNISYLFMIQLFNFQ